MELAAELIIPAQGLSPSVRQKKLEDYLHRIYGRKQHFAGFQTNQQVHFPKELLPFLNMNLLNLGDSFELGSYQVNSKDFEQAVLHYYSRLWQVPEPYWGYLTAMGSTEGNVFALWNARDFLHGMATHDWPEASPSTRTPVVLFSERGHYSLAKACKLLQLETIGSLGPLLGDYPVSEQPWPEAVPCDEYGRVDSEALLQLAGFFYQHGYPVVICLTLGTTFSGSCDDWQQVVQRLPEALPDNQADRRHYWVHIDGALAANYLPFWPSAEVNKQAADMRSERLHSICASPYKWLGMPWPCGVVMMKNAHRPAAGNRPNYIGSHDTTLSGSRSGLTAILLWDQLCRLGHNGQKVLSDRLQTRVFYAYTQLRRLFDHLDPEERRLVVKHPLPGSLILVFSQPVEAIVQRFSLSTDSEPVHGKLIPLCHLVVLEHCSFQVIDDLIIELAQPGAFALSDQQQPDDADA